VPPNVAFERTSRRLRYAHRAPGHLAPYAGKSGLAKPQDVEIDQAQNRTYDVRIADDKEDEILLQMNGVADGIRTRDNRNHNPGNKIRESMA